MKKKYLQITKTQKIHIMSNILPDLRKNISLMQSSIIISLMTDLHFYTHFIFSIPHFPLRCFLAF